ncbi:Uncharacterised protein [Serratia plymuthica]|uniref:Uncharacterized protein n=1 Tax=Serratia plymuthica TaxID=82996 RepID=A0A2X4VD02_SERPL|nr:Uncharacterised protein [Serratia plymuthica]
MPERRRVRQTLIIVVLALIVVAGLLIMAKEQQMNQSISPFTGRGNQALAQAVMRGDTHGIAEQATRPRLSEQGDRQVTLLQWAILSQQPQSLSSLLGLGRMSPCRGWRGTACCIPPQRCGIRSICGCC